MRQTNSYRRVLAVVTYWLVANKHQDCEKVREEPTVKALAMAERFSYLVSAVETDLLVKSGKLEDMAPYWSHGRWKTRGRLSKGAFCVIGVSELPILTYTSCHVMLIKWSTPYTKPFIAICLHLLGHFLVSR